MTPPANIQVGPQTYHLAKVAHLADTHDKWGITSHGHSEIQICADQEASKERVTVLHEALHAVWFNAGDRRDKQDEEGAIRILASGLLDTLRRNPELVAYLTAE